MARVMNTPKAGRRIIFAIQTNRKAGIGRPDFRPSLTFILANDTPKRNNVMGTVIAPISLAFRREGLVRELCEGETGESTCVDDERQRGFPVRTPPRGPTIKSNKQGLEWVHQGDEQG